ncbi:hypothetical protein HEP84_11190 [Streptomyces sp. RLB1-33]|uniref:hypothetical protein n=1 Tax=Streptomyces mirabilis TaxID=68239 RepID=UPI00143ECB2A|nr:MULTISPECIES: hypothetical protein [Streptomyces]QIY69647.1 hypothetical protein HEP84_11190 [Streptomyces sp. RLB1-33]QUW83481.1 hypothetical protein SMIR_33575 [Streptomyces mirabilis]
MADENLDRRSFLVRWSEGWAGACNADTSRGEQDEEARCALLRLVEPDETPAPRLAALPVFDGPEDLSERVDDYLSGESA